MNITTLQQLQECLAAGRVVTDANGELYADDYSFVFPGEAEPKRQYLTHHQLSELREYRDKMFPAVLYVLESDERGIYFPAQEKQPKVFWLGGEQPVPDWCEVEIWFRDGDSVRVSPSDMRWAHENIYGDILCFQLTGRIVEK